MIIITVLVPRYAARPEGLGYLAKYFEYVKVYVLAFVHFLSIYVLGMFFARHKNLIQKLYDYRYTLLALFVITFTIDLVTLYFFHVRSVTIPKIFLLLWIFGYLYNYDYKIKKHEKFNNIMNTIADYSFEIFFLHWYIIVGFNSLLGLEKYIPCSNPKEFVIAVLLAVSRFFVSIIISLAAGYVIKKILKKIGVKNTRMIIGA